VEHFQSTHVLLPSGHFEVRLPRKESINQLGESREQAVRRFLFIEKSLLKKGAWESFVSAVQEYFELSHAEELPPEDLNKPTSQVFYLLMHGVVKPESTTTKLRIVLDASAKSQGGSSLNDTIMVGPTIYPHITDILLKFRSNPVAVTADTSKMFCQVHLHNEDIDFHQFVFRASPGGKLKEFHMTRLTFGVSASPYIATQCLRQLAEIYHSSHQLASQIVKESFYVDDVLTGAESTDQAIVIQQQLNSLLSKGGFLVRKWRSNSPAVISAIPEDLREVEAIQELPIPAECHKTLGIHWNSVEDCLHISTAKFNATEHLTKRQLTSYIAKTFDILGWFTPATILMKILLQDVLELKIEWDELVPTNILDVWIPWCQQLHQLTEHSVPRFYYHSLSLSSEASSITWLLRCVREGICSSSLSMSTIRKWLHLN